MAKKRDAAAFAREVVSELRARDPRRTGITIEHDAAIVVEIAPRPRRGLRHSPQYLLVISPYSWRWTAELHQAGVGVVREVDDGPAESASLRTVANWIEKLVERVDEMTNPQP